MMRATGPPIQNAQAAGRKDKTHPALVGIVEEGTVRVAAILVGSAVRLPVGLHTSVHTHKTSCAKLALHLCQHLMRLAGIQSCRCDSTTSFNVCSQAFPQAALLSLRDILLRCDFSSALNHPHMAT
jgi:hypothetical protein